MTSEERPFHIAAVGVEALAQLRQLLLPIVVVAVVGGRDAPGMALLFGAAGAAATVVVAYVRWTTARWWVSDDAVHLRQGVLTRTESSVALARVQAVDTVRGPVQRLFGVVALHVQAAGGGRDGEVVLQAVTHADAELLRAAVRAGGAEPAAAAAQGAPAGPTWSLGRGRLLVAALTSGSLGVLVPIIAAGSQFGDEVLGNERAERLVPSTPAEAAMLVAAVLAFAWALSIAGALVAFSGFAVRREDDRLLIRRGIVERRDQSVPAARVHAVTVVEGLLREPFGLASVRLETAGYGSEAATTRTLVPLARRDEVPGILAELVPELAGEAGALAPPPRRSLRRYLLPPLAAGLAAAVALVAWLGTAGLPAVVLPLAGAAVGVGRFRSAGWRLADGRLVLRSRRLARSTLIADARRVQRVTASATLPQRRGDLASFAVRVSSGREASVRHLDRAVVDALADDVGALARTAPQRREARRSGPLAMPSGTAEGAT